MGTRVVLDVGVCVFGLRWCRWGMSSLLGTGSGRVGCLCEL